MMDSRILTNRQTGRFLAISLVLIGILLLPGKECFAQVGVGKWRDHLSYNETFKVLDAGERVYCSAAGGMFYFDKEDLTVNRLNKTTKLNDVGISTFGFDPQSANLVVAYRNANIDIVNGDRTTNISDIKRSNIGGNKQINGVAFNDRCAYLACGFGIVVIDMDRSEVKETYYIGDDGSYLNINDIVFTEDRIVAATDEGIKYADKRSPVLSIVSNWTADASSLIAGQSITRLVADGDNLMALVIADGDTTVYVGNGDMTFFPWLTGDIRNIKFTNGHIAVCYGDRLEIYDKQRNMEYSLSQVDWMKVEVNDAELTSDGRLWMAHRWAGMAVVQADDPSGVYIYAPDSPWDDKVARLVSFDEVLSVAPGGHSTTYTNNYVPATVYSMDKNGWHVLEDTDGILGGAFDIIDIAVNPRDSKTRMAAAWGYGIVEIRDNKAVGLYNHTNTDGALIPYAVGGFSSLRTGGVAYDKDGNLWVTNSLSQNALAVRYSNGNWNSFNTQNMISSSEIDHIVWDSIGNLKIMYGRANKIFLHDGENKMAYIDPNNGSKLETSMVNCVVQDHNGNLWIGTNKGIKVVYDLNKAFAGGGVGEKSPITCSNILYNENGISEYLLAYENITSIAVDGANRKWIGTSTGGLYLISANGLQQLQHFNSSNSPLFSDKIITLAIMPWSGELFVGTDYGLQSYRTTATYAFDEPMEEVYAFPNPVRPDYEGVIAIKGLTRNGLVHITDAAGHTVFTTKANGGEAVWNGCTLDGRRAASGVYYVFASSDGGSMRSVTKILIIR